MPDARLDLLHRIRTEAIAASEASAALVARVDELLRAHVAVAPTLPPPPPPPHEEPAAQPQGDDPWGLHTAPDVPHADPTTGPLRHECGCGYGIATAVSADGEPLCQACAERNQQTEASASTKRDARVAGLQADLAAACLSLPDQFVGASGPTTRHESRRRLLTWAGDDEARLAAAVARVHAMLLKLAPSSGTRPAGTGFDGKIGGRDHES